MPIVHRAVELVPSPDKATTLSIEKIKDEYYDFFEPDNVDPAEQPAAPSMSAKPVLALPRKPLAQISNLVKHRSVGPVSTPKERRALPRPMVQPKQESNEDDDVILLQTPPRPQVPSKAKIVIDLTGEEETGAETDKSFLNPKWRAEMNLKDCQTGFQSLWRRTAALKINPFPLSGRFSDEFLNATVTRQYISDVFGGNPHAVYPFQRFKNKGAIKRPGYDNFLCLSLAWNPRAPQRAGFPGLFHESGLESERGGEKRVHRVFIRLRRNIWLYVGNYVLVEAKPLTRREWLRYSDETKNAWVERACKSQWGDDVRMRIALRKQLGREPTGKEVEVASAAADETDSDDDPRASVAPEDAMAAFDSGKERLQAWVMKCVGYEEVFQREITEGIKEWNKAPKKKGKALPATNTGTTITKQSGFKGRNSKRKSSGSDEFEFEGDGNSNEQESSRKRKCVRKNEKPDGVEVK